MSFIKLLALGFVATSFAVVAAPEHDNDDLDEPEETTTNNGGAQVNQQEFETRAQTYLNGIKTLRSGYSQTNPDGSRVAGKFYLARSSSGYGKMRLEDPNQLIICNGNDLVHTDLKTKETNSYPISSTPAAFLLESTISFDDYKVTNFSTNGDKVSLTLVRRGDEESYSLALVFKTKPFLVISEWVVVDGQGNRTFVKLTGVEIGIAIDPNLFR